MTEQSRQPAGAPTGGQFGPGSRPEPDVALTGPGGAPGSAQFVAGLLTGAHVASRELTPVVYDYRDGAALLQSFPAGHMAAFTARRSEDQTSIEVRDESGQTASVPAASLTRGAAGTAEGVLAALLDIGPARDLGAGVHWFRPDGSPDEAEALALGLAMARTTTTAIGTPTTPTIHVADVARVEAYVTTRASGGGRDVAALVHLRDGRCVALEVAHDCTDYGGFEESVTGADARVGTRADVVRFGFTPAARRALALG